MSPHAGGMWTAIFFINNVLVIWSNSVTLLGKAMIEDAGEIGLSFYISSCYLGPIHLYRLWDTQSPPNMVIKKQVSEEKCSWNFLNVCNETNVMRSPKLTAKHTAVNFTQNAHWTISSMTTIMAKSNDNNQISNTCLLPHLVNFQE